MQRGETKRCAILIDMRTGERFTVLLGMMVREGKGREGKRSFQLDILYIVRCNCIRLTNLCINSVAHITTCNNF